MPIKDRRKEKRQNKFKEFYAEISKYISELENFTKLKIKIAENEGAIEKGFYTVNDILDDVYLQVFQDYDEFNEQSMRKILFRKTISKLNEIKKTESKPENTIAINSILKEELDLLQENYSVDAGGDFIPEEELDDISYHQKDFKPTHFILNDVLEDQLIGKVFKNFPANTGPILELHVFGNQNPSEISEILGIEKPKVNLIINTFLKEFKEKI